MTFPATVSTEIFLPHETARNTKENAGTRRNDDDDCRNQIFGDSSWDNVPGIG
jgi:hypothetical protein